MSIINKFISLTASQRIELIKIYFLMTFIAIKLRLSDYRPIMQRFRERLPANNSKTERSDRIIWLRRAVDISARFNIFGSCLDRSVTLWWLLATEGVDSQLRIGVTKKEGQFSAHAWLERNSEVINDRKNISDEYSVFDPDFAAGLRMR